MSTLSEFICDLVYKHSTLHVGKGIPHFFIFIFLFKFYDIKWISISELVSSPILIFHSRSTSYSYFNVYTQCEPFGDGMGHMNALEVGMGHMNIYCLLLLLLYFTMQPISPYSFVICIFITKISSHDCHLWQYLSTVLVGRGGLMFYSLCVYVCAPAYRDVKKTPAGQTSASTGPVPQYQQQQPRHHPVVGVTAWLSVWCDNTRTWQCGQVCLELVAR